MYLFVSSTRSVIWSAGDTTSVPVGGTDTQHLWQSGSNATKINGNGQPSSGPSWDHWMAGRLACNSPATSDSAVLL